ncbi:MAG: trigger factor [Ruminococcaceae bacterium]|nr:trigger factor [Oscillospiraceae bacterium]
MSLIKKELTEKSGFTMEFSVSKEVYAKAELEAYKKNVKSINIPGFRKGKAPKAIIEKYYGKDIWFEDAINACIPEAFEEAVKEAGLDIVGQPQFDLVSNDGDIVLKAIGFVKPEATIEGYKGIAVEKKVDAVSDADVDAEVENARKRNARTVDVTDRAAAMGDIANINYEGFVDGVAFDGGKGENHDLTLGSGAFIPGFEEQIVGKTIGEEFDVNVTFPEEYHAAELAGKAAIFKTKLNAIKFEELPALDDEFAKDVSEFDTLDEYKADIKAKMVKRNEDKAEREVENALANALMEKLVCEIPEVMFEAETENFVRDYDTRLRQSGLDMATYFKYTGMTLDGLRAQMRPQAEQQVKVRLALETIAKLEALTVSDEEIENEYKRISEAYNVPADQVKAMIAAEDIKADLLVGAAMKLVRENAKVGAAKAKKTTTKKAATAAEGEEKPAAKKTTTKKTAAKKDSTEEKTEEKKPAAKKTTKKAAEKAE